MKIAVAMSGGVDSSVAAALMTEKYGQENVFGVTMKLFCYGEGESSDKSCCSLDAIADAAAVCKQLGISHYVVNLEKEFQREVIDNFVSGYQAGTTPNPCVRCNEVIKYKYLLEKVIALGADRLVTGHYARIQPPVSSLVTLRTVSDESQGLRVESADLGISNGPSEGDPRVRKDDSIGSGGDSYHLLKGLDPLKDQSYFLYNLTQEQLSYLEFPIGEITKVETRALAKKFGLKTAEKTESQDICFVTSSVHDFLVDKIVSKTGNIVDSVGEIYGRHNGLHNYTIGQRKGLGGGYSGIMYVIGLDTLDNKVIIGPEEKLYTDSLKVENPHWIVDQPPLPLQCTAKIRYASEAAASTISSVEGHTVKVTFAEPQKAITPGQSVVFYTGDEVIGGGVITVTSK